ncbi:MAG: V-type ATP synthase subunit F [Candidatus Aminicenantes bacterium]|nr:V-type ATP synthase subunit F [Candidatus Aminicenantes bacterium]
MFDRVAVVGDCDLIFPLRLMGVRVYSPQSEEEARQVLQSLEEDNIALCFLHERFFKSLTKEREAMAGKFCPVIAGFSDYRVVTDHLGRMMRDMAVKATGSDSLVKRRGNDETR